MRLLLRRAVQAALIFAAAAMLSACGNRGLYNLSRGLDGPDEFAILPNRPIVIPDQVSLDLPPPTPGQPNRVDRNPRAEAVAALGGDPSRVTPSGAAPRTDGALLATTQRYGVDPSIRASLARQDAEFRRRNRGRPLERLFGLTLYYDIYERQSLDQTRELDRLRAAGVRTPGAPPEADD